MSNLWLLAQMRQPGRVFFADVSLLTFPRMLRELLSKKNFNLKKELLDDKNVVAPSWGHCTTYKNELRKEACKCARETAVSFSSASTGCFSGCSLSVWPTLQVPLHKQTLKNWRYSKEKLLNSGTIGLGRPGSRFVVTAMALGHSASSSTAFVTKSRGKGRKGKSGGNGGKKVIDKTKTWCLCPQRKIQNLP